MMEEWRDIKGFEGKYQVSSLGRVKSLNYLRTGEEKIIKMRKDKNGYLLVNLSKNNKYKTLKVHRLVATAFIDNPNNKPCIDHINAIKDDNRVSNLRWVTYKENANNPITRKRQLDNSPIAGKFGKDHPSAKAVCQYSLDGKLIKEWSSMMDAERELGFHSGHISLCCLGKQKTAYNFFWQYA